MPMLRNGSKADSNPGSLDCGVLPLSHRAPRMTSPRTFDFELSAFLAAEYGVSAAQPRHLGAELWHDVVD